MAHIALSIIYDQVSVGLLITNVDDEISIMRANMEPSTPQIILINLPNIDLECTHISFDWPKYDMSPVKHNIQLPITYRDIPDGTTHVVLYIKDDIYRDFLTESYENMKRNYCQCDICYWLTVIVDKLKSGLHEKNRGILFKIVLPDTHSFGLNYDFIQFIELSLKICPIEHIIYMKEGIDLDGIIVWWMVTNPVTLGTLD